MITVGELVKRGSLDQFYAAFDLVKLGADNLKAAIAIQRLKASFKESAELAQSRYNADMKTLGCSQLETGGWQFPLDKPEKGIARTNEFTDEVLPLGDLLTVEVTKDESLRKIIDADANILLSGIIHIPTLDG